VRKFVRVVDNSSMLPMSDDWLTWRCLWHALVAVFDCQIAWPGVASRVEQTRPPIYTGCWGGVRFGEMSIGKGLGAIHIPAILPWITLVDNSNVDMVDQDWS
jgi:hypothetical protein